MRALTAGTVVLVALLVGCGTNRELVESDRRSSDGTATAVRPSATATVTPTPRPSPPPIQPSRTPVPAATPLPLTPLAGLTSEVREPTIGARVVLPAPPVSALAVPADTRLDDTLLIDTVEGVVTNLHRGFRGAFSPDGTRMTWVRITSQPAGEVRLIDLATGDQRRLGPGLDSAPWVDEDTVLSVTAAARERIAITVSTGAARPAPAFDPPDAPFTARRLGDLQLVRLATGSPQTFEVRDLSTEQVLIRFEAEAAALASASEVVIAVPAGTDLRSNIYLVDVATARGSLVASTSLEVPSMIALSATEQRIAWTERYCAGDGRLLVYDRASGLTTEVETNEWAVLTPEDELALGEFGATSIFDLDNGSYRMVLPTPQNQVSWSPDYRYASVGAQLEQRSECP